MTDRPTLEDLDAPLEPARWCCGGNAEDCPLCMDPNLPYPFLCPGHPRTAANERIVGETVQPATEATELDKKRRYLRPVVQWLRRAPAWGVAFGLALVVLSTNVGLPFLVSWLWPGINSTVLVLGNLFLGMILGSAAVMAFLVWYWEVRR